MTAVKISLVSNKIKISIALIAVVLLVVIYLNSNQNHDVTDRPVSGAVSETSPAIGKTDKTPRVKQPKPPVNQPLPDNAQTQMVCKNTLKANNDIRSWRREKQAYIRTFIDQLVQDGTETSVLDKVFIESGMGLYKGRATAKGYQRERKKPPFYQGETQRASTQNHILVQSKFKAGDIDGLANAIREQRLVANDHYLGKKGAVFLLGYLLENQIDAPAELITRLIDSGLAVFYSDLAKATTLNLPEPLVNMLFVASRLQANKVLHRRHKYTSLALIAITKNNAELARYWVGLGSPVQPDLFANNALDLLANHGRQMQKADIDALFEDIISADITPFNPTSVKKLKALISPALFTRYQEQLLKTAAVLSPEQIRRVESAVRDIHNNILKDVVDFELNTEPKHQCFDEMGQWLTLFAMKSKSSKKKANKSANKVAHSEQTSIESLIAKAKGLHSHVADIESELGKTQSLGNKRALEQYRNQQLAELTKGFADQIKNTPQLKEKNATAMEVIKLAQAGKWVEAMALFDTLEHSNENAKTSLVLLAINAEVDFSIIKSLLNDGAQLMPYVIVQIIAKDNVKLANQLLPYGLDLNYNEMGYSTLARSVQWNASNMFNFLLQQDVPIDSDGYGFDALDVALKQFDRHSTGLTYISALISAGAKIELSHREIVDRMKLRDMEGYYLLTSNYSQLKL